MISRMKYQGKYVVKNVMSVEAIPASFLNLAV